MTPLLLAALSAAAPPAEVRWFRKAIDRGVQKGIDDGLRSCFAPGGPVEAALERIVWEQTDEMLPRDARLTSLGFIWALRLCFRRHGSSYAEASKLANSTLRQYLADEKIRFGDRQYSWTRGDAEEVAKEYELRHWEAA